MVCIGGSRGGREGRTPPPWASKFFRFHAVFGKIWRVHAPPGGFTPPPWENPGSATGMWQEIFGSSWGGGRQGCTRSIFFSFSYSFWQKSSQILGF